MGGNKMYSLFYNASLMLTLLFSSVFAGSGGDLMLQMLEKAMDVQSYEQTSYISFELEYSGGDEVFQDSMRRAKDLVEALEYTIHTVLDSDLEEGKYSMYTEALISLDPIQIKGSMWMDIDAASDASNFDIAVKIPSMVKAFLPEEYAKDYLHIEADGLLKLAKEEDEHSLLRMMNFLNFFNTHSMRQKFLEMTEPMNLAQHLSDNISLSVAEAEDGKAHLTLKMTDAQFKNFVLALLNELDTNEEAIDALLDILFATFGANDNAFLLEAKNEFKQDILDWLDEFVPEIEEYFAENAFLSRKGFVYEAVLNQDGYVESETTVIGMSFGNDMINPFSSRRYYFDNEDVKETDAAVDFTMIFKTEYENINGEVEVNFPELNNGNSFNIADAIRKSIEDRREASKYYFPYGWYQYDKLMELEDEPVSFPLKGTARGETVDTEISIMYSDYDYYMPLSQIAGIFGGEVSWDAEAKVAVWSINGRKLAIIADMFDYYAYLYYEELDEEELDEEELDEEAGHLGPLEKYFDSDYHILNGEIVNNRMFIRVIDVERNTNVDFGFDDEKGIVLVRD